MCRFKMQIPVDVNALHMVVLGDTLDYIWSSFHIILLSESWYFRISVI